MLFMAGPQIPEGYVSGFRGFGNPLKRFDSASLVKVQHEIELLRKASVKVLADTLGFRQVNDSVCRRAKKTLRRYGYLVVLTFVLFVCRWQWRVGLR
jgi:hypothetical protein